MDVPRDKTALLVIDMQNGFCHPKGSFASLGMDIRMCTAAIAGCRTLVDAAHAADVPVVYSRYVYQPNYADGGILVDDLIPAIKEIGSLAAGSWDADIVDELTPADGDIIIDKSRYSAFYSTRLESVLTSRAIRSLVVCGVTTNMCVETTARDASQRDYRVFVVDGATGELDEARHRHALNTLGFGFGWVVNVEQVTEAWGSRVTQGRPV